MENSQSNILVSYNRKDLSEVQSICVYLRARGIAVWHDLRSIVPGEIWRLEIEKAIREAQVALVMIGPSGMGPTQQSEVAMCLTEAERQKIRLIPVLLPLADTKNLPFISFLKNYAWIDFRNGLFDAGFRDLICSIENRPLDLPVGDISGGVNGQSATSPLGLVWAYGTAKPRILGLALSFSHKEFVTGAETRRLVRDTLVNGQCVEVRDSTGGRHRITYAIRKSLSHEVEFGILQTARHGLGVFRSHAGESGELEIAMLPSQADQWEPGDPWIQSVIAVGVRVKERLGHHILSMAASNLSCSVDGAPAFDFQSRNLVGVSSRSSTGELFVVSIVGLEKAIKKAVRS